MDTISNFIIKLKNAGNARHESVVVPYSNLKVAISEVLKQEGFIKNYEVRGDKRSIYIELVVENKTPKIKGVERISKPSKRIYKKAEEIRTVKSGYGALILSTSAGVMTGRRAKKEKLGGEALFNIW